MSIPVFVVNSHEAKFDVLIKRIETLIGLMATGALSPPAGGPVAQGTASGVSAGAGDAVPGTGATPAPAASTNLRGAANVAAKVTAAAVVATAVKNLYDTLPDGAAPVPEPEAAMPDQNDDDNDQPPGGNNDQPPGPGGNNDQPPGPGGNGSPGVNQPSSGSGASTDSPDLQQPAQKDQGSQTIPQFGPKFPPLPVPGSFSPAPIKAWSQLTQKERNATIATLKKPVGWGMMTNAQQQAWRKQQYLKVQRAAVAKEKKDNETAVQELAKVNADILAENIKRAKDALPPIKQLTPPADWATLTIKQKDEWRAKAYANFKQQDAARMQKIIADLKTPVVTPVPDVAAPEPVVTGGQVPPPFNAPANWATMTTEEQKQWISDNNSVVPKPANAPHDWARYNTAQKKHWLAEHKTAPAIAPAKAEVAADDKVAYVDTPQGMADSNCSVAGNYLTNFEHNLRKPMAFYSAFAATDLNMVGSLAVITPNSPAAKERAALINLPMAEQLKMASLTTPMPSYNYVCSLENAYSCGYNATQSNLIAKASEAGTALPQFDGNSNVPTPIENITPTSDLRAKMYDDSFAPEDHDEYVIQQSATAKERADEKSSKIAAAPLPPIQTDTDAPEVIKTSPVDVTDPTSIPSNAGN